MQTVLSPERGYQELDRYMRPFSRIFLVCGSSFRNLAVGTYLEKLAIRNELQMVRFSGFSPNPDWEEIEKGIELFQASVPDVVVAVGGGSAIDTAKCIRYSFRGEIPLLAVPTTAGSGSEATHFAVVYRQGVKESVDCGLPDAILLDPSALDTLPPYQRKATMLDALCHGIESFWSLKATRESRAYSRRALQQIMSSYQGYLENTPKGNAGMLQGANWAGRAINIAQTTAGHAMCYSMTKRFGLAHGHAAALCVSKLWPWLLDQSAELPEELADAMGCNTLRESAERFQTILSQLKLKTPVCTEEELADMAVSVNPERLGNFPIPISEQEILKLYREILRGEGER